MTAMTLRIPKVLRHFTRDRRGVSAVEFAFVLPIMCTLYFGCAEITNGLSAAQKVTLTASTLANLAAANPPGQVTNYSTSDMTNILNASTAIIAPFSVSNMGGTVSCLKIDAKGKATVAWSAATLNGTARATASVVTIPPDLATPSTSLLLGEASYAYTPTVAYTITGTINLSDKMFMRPRFTPAPQYNGTSC